MAIAQRLANAVRPNRVIDPVTATMLLAIWAGASLTIWFFSPWKTLPTPIDVFHAIGPLWWDDGLGPELFSTVKLIFTALALTILISLALSYVTVIAAFRPLIAAASKLRFLGLTGLVFPFTLMTASGYQLKVALLTFGMTTFFVTSMAQIVIEIPRQQFDHMRVLGASELRILWEIVVLGTADKALEVMRQNVAMGWAMITMVEGISRQGGIGELILNLNKYFKLSEVYACLFVILALGLVMDFAIGVLTNLVCPYSAFERVRR